jgi:hypothetical protein
LINVVVNNHTSSKNVTIDDIDRSCLRALRCPDTRVVKNQLKEYKDKLLYKSIDWILEDPQYLRWRDGDDVRLLWIKGGAGKGKTMMSIGLIERSLPQDESTVVTYFFCQNADYELNTLEAIIKGLILQLVNQQIELKESLRCRWDTTNEHFDEDITSWRTLWNIFLEMLYRCRCPRVYVIVDALDECQDDSMADLLKLIVRTGLDHPTKIKWLLTSRPLDSAEQELLAGSEQLLVNLELNSKHVSEAVKTYIAFKAGELDRRNAYGPTLRRKIQAELASKAKDTYLWVSLVCKRLESVHRDEALATIEDLSIGSSPLYDQVFHQLSKGDSAVAKGCMRLLISQTRTVKIEKKLGAYGKDYTQITTNSRGEPDEPRKATSAIVKCILDHTQAESVLQVKVKPKPQRRSEPVSGRNPTHMVLVSSKGREIWLNAGPCTHGCVPNLYLYGRLPNGKRSGLVKHIQRHHKISPYPCAEPECSRNGSRGFFRPGDLKRHKETKHSSRSTKELISEEDPTLCNDSEDELS